MTNTPESPKTATTIPAPVAETATQAHGNPDSPTRMICDLGQANGFSDSGNKPHVPILAAFGGDDLHVCSLRGSWDLDRADSENADVLIRSIRRLPAKSSNSTAIGWDDLTLQFGSSAGSTTRKPSVSPRDLVGNYLSLVSIPSWKCSPERTQTKSTARASGLPPDTNNLVLSQSR